MVPRLAAESLVRSPPFRHDSFTEPASTFHERELLGDPAPRLVECRSTVPTLVLGSVQRRTVVDESAVARYDIAVARRRSGGGAVLVMPGQLVWFDVVVPAVDRRFGHSASDVTASMRWLGTHIVSALGALGMSGVQMHEGPIEARRWGRLVCFAGTAPGEVTIDGRKLVGISQRRTRVGARFQCAVHTTWAPDRLVSLLTRPRPTTAELPEVATLEPGLARALPVQLVRVLNAL